MDQDRQRYGRLGQALLGLLLGCLLVCGSSVAQQPDLLGIRTVTGAEGGIGIRDILAGEYDSQFLPETTPLNLLGDRRNVYWLRLQPLAGLEDGETRWRLRFDRLPLERVELYVPQADGPPHSHALSFYAPNAEDGVLSDGLVFDLPSPLPELMFVSITTRVDVSITPQLLAERRHFASERRLASLHGAVYSALVVMVLTSLMLFFALHVRDYLHFALYAISLTLSLAALNGHAYALPGFRMLAGIGPLGISAFLLLTAAAGLWFTRHFVSLRDSAPQLDKPLRWAIWGLLALSILAFSGITSLQRLLFAFALYAWPLSALAAAITSFVATGRGQRGALPTALIWLAITAASSLRVAMIVGWMTPDAWSLSAFQLLLASAVLLLSVVLSGRVMDFRLQRDEAQEITEQSTALAQTEQRRRELVEGLHEVLRDAPAGDLQWIGMRRLLVSLSSMLPNSAMALVASGYHGRNLLLAEPGEAKQRMLQLFSERGGNIKGICRGRTPMQLLFTASEQVLGADGKPVADPVLGRFAVVPLDMDKPAWGGLLIENNGDGDYVIAELKRLSEFARIAIEITDQAMSQLDLRRRAEMDSLTGTFNRRGGEAMLQSTFERAQQDRIPLSALMIDLDYFRQLNEKHGSAVGDECLRMMSECLRRQLRSEDLVSRWGGEEFLVLLPGQSTEQARRIAERVREAVGGLRVRGAEDAVVKFTVSIGVASRTGSETAPMELVERADRAMFQAKRNGRNRVLLSAMRDNSGPAPDDLVL